MSEEVDMEWLSEQIEQASRNNYTPHLSIAEWRKVIAAYRSLQARLQTLEAAAIEQQRRVWAEVSNYVDERSDEECLRDLMKLAAQKKEGTK